MFIGKLKYLNLIDKKEKNMEKTKLKRVEITEIFKVIMRALIISIITQPNIHDQQVSVLQNLILRIQHISKYHPQNYYLIPQVYTKFYHVNLLEIQIKL